MRAAAPGATLGSVQAVPRLADRDKPVLADAAVAVVGAMLTAVCAWDPGGALGGKSAQQPWALLVLVSVLMGASLALRRRMPLLMWTGIWAGIALRYLISPHQSQGPEFLFAMFAGGYALGVYASPRRALAGLALAFPVIVIVGRLGLGLSLVPILACWLFGVFVRSRRRAAVLARHNTALRDQAERAATAERARIARELHDIVAHHLSVIVLQAAGARASGSDAGPTLEKIENSGRQALAETRRLLGVLHESGEDGELAPQPGIGELDALAGTVRAAGLPVSLIIDGDAAGLPAAVDVSVYRIVQEALTNVLKHAGPAHADVLIGCTEEAVTIEITDDGTNPPVPGGGHGLAGMRERAAIFGGELHAGPRPSGGFAVRARLPRQDAAS